MPPIKQEGNCLHYYGSNFFKQRLVLSCLSGKSVKIERIRAEDTHSIGLKPYEVSLIRLLDRLTNGTKIEMNASGTSVMFTPGLLHGGQLEHDCAVERGIGYYLDALLALGPFCKNPLQIKLRGVTNSKESASVDHIKAAALPILKRFLVTDDEDLSIKITRRGLAPSGGGEIIFRCPVRKNIRALQFDDAGMVKRIRGMVYASKVSPAFANRTVESAKGVLLKFLPDIYINTDQNRGKLAGNSPGFGVCLYAETTDGVVFAAENISKTKDEQADPDVPEDIGREAAYQLLEEIYRGGCCDSTFQWLVALFMALAKNNASKYVTGPLSTYTVNFLQHLRDFFSITFKLENPSDDDSEKYVGAQKVILTCVGIGYTNLSKRVI